MSSEQLPVSRGQGANGSEGSPKGTILGVPKGIDIEDFLPFQKQTACRAHSIRFIFPRTNVKNSRSASGGLSLIRLSATFNSAPS